MRATLRVLWAGWPSVLIALNVAHCPAGGGPENLFLVVNERSFASRTLASYYVRLRQIPASNVLLLPWEGGLDGTDVATFRQEILGPALTALQQRGLTKQIDYLVYSSDFPTVIDYEVDMRRPQPARDKALASITSLSYFWQAVLDGDVNSYASLTANRYYRAAESTLTPSQGFRSSYGWDEKGTRTERGRPAYLLSTMLGVTSGRGSSLREAVDSLRIASTADGTSPKGTVYFMVNGDIRTQTRMSGYPLAAAELKRLGVNAEMLQGTLPSRRNNIAGVTLGSPTMPWGAAQARILPGAICDNLTSAAGIFTENASQTTLTEALKYGAAGASGTVTEPYAIPQKFPAPTIHVHYARGCSLAEAYYQSVQGPFQLLIVGDPICRPWATVPQVSLAVPPPDTTVSGKLELRPSSPSEDQLARYELFIDGLRQAEASPGQPLIFDTESLPDGHHELRVVAIESSPIESQGRVIVNVMFDNHHRRVELTAATSKAAWGQTIELKARSEGAATIAIEQAGRRLGEIKGSEGTLPLDARTLGLGPVAVQAIALDADQQPLVVSAPVTVDIGPGSALPARDPAKIPDTLPGLMITLADGTKRSAISTAPTKWLEAAGVGRDADYTVEGWVTVPADDIYQFQVRYLGHLELHVDGQSVHTGDSNMKPLAYVPLVLAKGRHHLELRGHSGAAARVDIQFGGPGSKHLVGPAWGYVK